MTEAETRLFVADKTALYESGLINQEQYLGFLTSINWTAVPSTFGYRDYLLDYVNSIIEANS